MSLRDRLDRADGWAYAPRWGDVTPLGAGLWLFGNLIIAALTGVVTASNWDKGWVGIGFGVAWMIAVIAGGLVVSRQSRRA